MSKRVDLRGEQFGELTAREPTSGRDKDGSVIWRCTCSCGNETFVGSNRLRTGHVKSCGCIRGAVIAARQRKVNTYDMSGDYGVGYATNTGKKFLFDKEDYDRICRYAWRENDSGYIVASINGKNVRLHRFVFPCDRDEIVDHRSTDRSDNRKSNLRIATKQQNNINRAASRNNTLKAKGITYNPRTDRYEARISVNGKVIRLGCDAMLDRAIQIRERSERELFGEFAYQREVAV